MTSVNELIDDYLHKMKEVSNRVHESGEVYEDFLSKLKNLTTPEPEVAAILATMVNDPCREHANLWLIAAQLHPSITYLDSLTRILEIDDPCIWHEALVDLIYDLPVENAIKANTLPSLKKALNYHYGYDYGHSLTKKILETLALIGTKECWEIIKPFLYSDDISIRELVQVLLEELTNSDSPPQN